MSLARSVRRSRAWRAIASALVALGVGVALLPAAASEKNKNLTTQDKARQLREASEARAARNLGYPTVFPSDPPASVDYYALGMMMARLAAAMQGMEGAAAAGAIGRPGGSAATLGSFMAASAPPAYGPDGPTEKSVKLILEYRLMLAGNPRLQVGTVKDKGEAIHASVVTAEGSLVEEYDVSKATGVWTPVRKDK